MEITAEQLKQKIQNGDKVIVDFWATWCGPCKIMKPSFDKVSKQLMDENYGVELYTMDVEKNQGLALELGIRAVPTIKLFDQGKEVYSKSGLQTEEQIKDLAKELLNG
jgi:thioredoxin 1